MKCDIIKDLLVLYADNLCSEESRKTVEEHLAECEDCKKYYNNLSAGLPEVIIDDAIIEDNLKGKDLLLKSKNTIRFAAIQKALKIINAVFIAVDLLIITAGLLFMVKAYSARYPVISMDTKYLVLYGAFLLPFAVGIIEIVTLQKIKHYIIRIIGNLFLQLLCAAICIVSAICLFVIMPPLKSATDNPADYLAVDSQVQEYSEVYENFFPHKIPANAEMISYSYVKEEALFSEKVKIRASWKLSEKEYENEKDRVLQECHAERNEDGSYNIAIAGLRYPGKVEMCFKCDDKEKKLTYIFNIDRSY